MKFKKASQRVQPDGTEIFALINGVKIRDCITHVDNRGSLTESMSTAWDFDSEPIVHIYKVAIDPGIIKGWQYHKTYSDRSFFGWGKFRIVLHDLRKKSSTYKKTITIYAGVEKPRLIRIPPYVLHAVQNLGTTESWFINMPTKIYDYKDPDKYRIPWNSKLVKYNWERNIV